MAAPTPYIPAYNFTNFQTANPSTPLPANALDAELFDIRITTDQLISNLGAIQRSDGALANTIVTPDSLNTSVLNLIGGYTPRGTWITATAYAAKDVVNQASGTYLAVSAHTSGVFATDLAAGKWVLIAGTSGTATLATLSDVVLTSPAANQLLSYDGTHWVNSALALANVPDGLLTFAKLNSAVYSTSGTLAGADDTHVPTTLAVKSYCTTQAFRATGSDIVAAATTSLTGAFDYVHVTGNTGISAITLNANEEKWVLFTGTPVITHNGTSLILPGAANITAAANDRALFRGINGTNVICLSYVRANGQSVASIGNAVANVKQQVFNGSGTYTPSTGMLFCIVESVDGGGGGGSTKIASASNCAVALGGWGGAYGRTRLTAAQIGVSQTVTIGAGGTVTINDGSSGNAGGITSLGTLHVGVAAPGGLGSTNATTSQTQAIVTSNTAYATADFSIPGGPPGDAFASVGALLAIPSVGGSSFWGWGGKTLPLVASGNTSTNSNNGASFGGGGSGGASLTNTTGSFGGSGRHGYMVITEFCSQ